VVQGQTRVSTGQTNHEIMASTAPGDTIYSPVRGTVGSRRYPWPGNILDLHRAAGQGGAGSAQKFGVSSIFSKTLSFWLPH